jgi:glycosyltransferase involved in cell wall biosynthesis
MNFSVLISVYYKEKPEYLEDAINSIFNQTLLPKEVILVEDGKLTDELYNTIRNCKRNIMR